VRYAGQREVVASKPISRQALYVLGQTCNLTLSLDAYDTQETSGRTPTARGSGQIVATLAQPPCPIALLYPKE
jgi:hypothetical protein